MVGEVLTARRQATMSEAQYSTRPYVLGLKDFFVVSIRLYLESMMRPLMIGLQVVAFIGLPLWINRFAIQYGEFSGALETILLLFAVVYIALPPLFALLSWTKISGLATARGERIVSVAPSRISGSGKAYDLSLDWSALIKIRRGFGQILFYTRPDAAIIVPESAFASEKDSSAFYTAAVGYWTAAKGAK